MSSLYIVSGKIWTLQSTLPLKGHYMYSNVVGCHYEIVYCLKNKPTDFSAMVQAVIKYQVSLQPASERTRGATTAAGAGTGRNYQRIICLSSFAHQR